MKRDQALAAADRAAQAVWHRRQHWLEPHMSLGMVAPLALMQVLIERHEATAEMLYRGVSQVEAAERPWRTLSPQARAAFHVFRATYSVLLQHVDLEHVCAAGAD